MNILNNSLIKREKRPIKVLQIGEGNFLRGFIDYFIAYLNENHNYNCGVCVVQPRKGNKLKELQEQDGLYTLVMEGLLNDSPYSEEKIIDVIEDLINPYSNYSEFLEYAHSNDLNIIFSNTTEAGIVLDLCDTDFSTTPNTYPGKLLALLKERYEYFYHDKTKGLYIIPCELVVGNGDLLKSTLVSLSKACNFNEDFINWLTTANKFYNTLVDRIVPGHPCNDDLKKLFNKLNYVDNKLIKSELYHLFALSGDKSLNNVFPYKESNLQIIVANDISPYYERKVKILNASHSCIAPIAYLCGLKTVRESILNNEIKQFLDNFLLKEALPSINFDYNELISYKNDVITRFSNPFIEHKLQSIFLNSMSKYKVRILPTAITYYENNKKLPYNSLFAFAALLNLYSQYTINDESNIVNFFNDLYSKNPSSKEIIETSLEFLELKEVYESMKGACDFLIATLDSIKYKGALESLKSQITLYE